MGRSWRALAALVMVAGLGSVSAAEPAGAVAGHRRPGVTVRELRTSFIPWQVNNRGQILGTRSAEDQELVLYERGRLTTVLPALTGEDFHYLVFLNERGDVAGSIGHHFGQSHTPFLWSGGRPVSLGTFESAAVLALNDRGQVLLEIREVSAGGRSGPTYAVWDDGVLTPAPAAPPGRQLTLTTLGDTGVAGGHLAEPGGYRGQQAVIWRPGGELVTLDPEMSPERGSSYVRAVTPTGLVVGERHEFDRPGRVFVWRPATGVVDLPMPDPAAETSGNVLAVNDRGHIVVVTDGSHSDRTALHFWNGRAWTRIDTSSLGERAFLDVGWPSHDLNNRDQVVVRVTIPAPEDGLIPWPMSGTTAA